jgi:hypothetical protein
LAQVEYNQKIKDLDKQIHQLLMLTHQPEPKPEDNGHDLVGELIDEARDPFDVVDAEVIEPELVKDELDHICDYRGADHE